MKKYIGQISYKTLSSTLKELEADQLVHREEYPQIPPKVEYSLTERGKSLIPILDGMCEWGDPALRQRIQPLSVFYAVFSFFALCTLFSLRTLMVISTKAQAMKRIPPSTMY